jgi:hypothetical protein
MAAKFKLPAMRVVVDSGLFPVLFYQTLSVMNPSKWQYPLAASLMLAAKVFA